jgi:hypothetical protein
MKTLLALRRAVLLKPLERPGVRRAPQEFLIQRLRFAPRGATWIASSIFAWIVLASATACAQVDVVTNGSFELGSLAGWTVAPSDSGSGECGYNEATAPGTETLSSTPGFPATAGVDIALGSAHLIGGTRFACVLYQNVVIPPLSATAILSADIGIKPVLGQTAGQSAVEMGLFSTASVPFDFFGGGTTILVPPASGEILYQTLTSDTTLQHQTLTMNVTALAGTTVRLAFLIISTNTSGGTAVAGLDNIHLFVSPAPPALSGVATPTLGEWWMLALALLLGIGGYFGMRVLSARGAN